MSTHIGALPGQIAETVFLPGDPVRAEKIAEAYFDDRLLYNEIRNMWGYTGITSDGKRFSVQGSGMGQPSLSIYVNELIKDYGVKRIIRIGTCGSYQSLIPCGDIIIPTQAITDSNMVKLHYPKNKAYVPKPSYELYSKACKFADKKGIRAHRGSIISSDIFYDPKKYDKNEEQDWQKLAKEGLLAVEMESAMLFTLGEKYGIETMSILSVSDVIPTGEHISSQDREHCFEDMMKIGLELV